METMERNLMVWLQKSMEQKVMAKFNADMEKKLQSPVSFYETFLKYCYTAVNIFS
jgi:hypothetical protein